MSLYREVGARRGWTVVAIVAAILVGLVAGVVVGRATSSSPSLAAQAEDVRSRLQEAADALELVGIEYAQAVRSGSVVAETELAATRGALDRARGVLDDVNADLEVLSPGTTDALQEQLAELAAQIDDHAPPATVEQTAAELRDAIRSVAG